MVKGAQLALASGKDVRDMVMDLTWAHRTTRNLTSGEVPFTMMRARQVGTKLFPTWM